jgi:3D (Asp-Asp-Asp) domain-containing protein
MRALRYTLFIIGILYAKIGIGQNQSNFLIPPPEKITSTQKLWATYYFVHAAQSTVDGLPFRDKAGAIISDKVHAKDWCSAAIEGTVRVGFNGKEQTLNYNGIGSKTNIDCASVLKINPKKKPWINSIGKSYFTKAKGSYGDGVNNYHLIPFRTIAVDQNKFAYGSVIFIPQAQGLEIKLPAGETLKHDGYFFAADTGGAIKGSHIDVFCGTSKINCFPEFVKSDKKSKFDAVLIRSTEITRYLEEKHRGQ